MHYTIHPTIRHWLPLPWVVPSWEQLSLGLPCLPPSLYMPTVLALPLLTLNTLLLDAAPAVSTPVVGGIVSVVILVVSWLLNRTITGFDNATKETKDAVTALTHLVTEMRLERKDDRVLTTYLKDRQDKLEKENEILRGSFAAFDKQIAVAVATKQAPAHE